MISAHSRFNVRRSIAVIFTLLVVGNMNTNAASNPDDAATQSLGSNQSPGQGTDSSQAKSPDDVICKRQKVIGTHMRVKVCSTRAQREEQRRIAEEIMTSRRGGINASNETQ